MCYIFEYVFVALVIEHAIRVRRIVACYLCGCTIFSTLSQKTARDKVVHVTTASRVLRLRVEERPPIWKVATNILNRQSRTADKGWSSSLAVVDVLTTSHRKNVSFYEMFAQKASDVD
jgi:hypothetical protein